MARTAPPPFTLVVGPEELLVERAVTDVVTGVRRSAGGTGTGPDPVEVVRVDPAATAAGSVAELLSPSLFGEPRVVVVEQAEAAGDAFVDAVEQHAAPLVGEPGDIWVVLLHKGGARGRRMLDLARRLGAAEVECPEIRWDSDKERFVAAELRRARRSITADGAKALVDAAGSDLRALAAACAQLAADTATLDGADGPEEIDAAVVDRYFGGRVEATSFEVADAAVEGRAGEALGLLRHALATGVAHVLLTSALASTLRNVARVADAGRGRSADVARELRLRPFQVDKARRQARSWTPEGLSAALRAVADADAEVKGAAVDAAYALERMVVRVTAATGV